MLGHLKEPLFKDRIHTGTLRTYSINEKIAKDQAEVKDTSSISNSNAVLNNGEEALLGDTGQSNSRHKVAISKNGDSTNNLD